MGESQHSAALGIEEREDLVSRLEEPPGRAARHTAKTSPTSVRLPTDLQERIHRHLGIRAALGQTDWTLSRLATEAITAYLDGFEPELCAALRELLDEDR